MFSAGFYPAAPMQAWAPRKPAGLAPLWSATASGYFALYEAIPKSNKNHTGSRTKWWGQGENLMLLLLKLKGLTHPVLHKTLDIVAINTCHEVCKWKGVVLKRIETIPNLQKLELF